MEEASATAIAILTGRCRRSSLAEVPEPSKVAGILFIPNTRRSRTCNSRCSATSASQPRSLVIAADNSKNSPDFPECGQRLRMRIVTYNFLRAGSLKRCGHWSRVIRNLKADLVLAQECRPPHSTSGERFRHEHNDGFAWQAAGNRDWGSGLLARSASLVPIAIPDYEGWVVGGEIRNTSWSKHPLLVFSIHGPAGERGYIRTMQHILDRIASLRERAALVL